MRMLALWARLDLSGLTAATTVSGVPSGALGYTGRGGPAGQTAGHYQSPEENEGREMNPTVVTTIVSAVGLLAALWTILANFDKRNQDRFAALEKQIDVTEKSLQKQIDATEKSLQKQIDATEKSLQKQIEATKETLRAETREMRAELRLEIKEAAERRIVRG